MPQPSRSRTSQTTPGARRPPQRKGDLTGQAIRDALSRLLARRSLAEITVDEIAKGSGISRSAFYFHYESREAVLHALTEQITDDLYTSGTAWFRRTDESPGDALRRAITQTVALWREHGAVLRASVRARDTDPSLSEFWSEVRSRFTGAVAEQINREREAGIAAAGPPTARRLAALLLTMNEQSCFSHSLTRRSQRADTEFIDAVCTIWMRAVYGTG